MNRRRMLLLTVAALAMTSCGIQTDSAPRNLPDSERGPAAAGSSSGSDASGADRIYLVAPGDERLLRSVPRDAALREDLMRILLLGPNDDEIAAQYSSFIPPDTQLLSARSKGQILIVDVTGEIAELTGQSLSQAIAQIVYTATEIDGIEAVQLKVDGVEVAWPKPNGEITADPLRIYDYPNFVQTAQPAYPAVPVGI
ncbi:MAG TPA: GerMN domain-containing protein [Ilumatobacter sp.]|nr:GerMN domain-containing protein [Ilumatobacter sp.]